MKGFTIRPINFMGVVSLLKIIVVSMLVLNLISCMERNEQYYREHPKELQEAVKSCSSNRAQDLNCETLSELSKRLNKLAYELQYSPQAFGLKILALQQTIANQETALNKHFSKSKQTALMKNKSDLADDLAVVKWLESPEG